MINTITIQLRNNAQSLTASGEGIGYHQDGNDWMVLTQPNPQGPDATRQEFSRISVAEIVSIWILNDDVTTNNKRPSPVITEQESDATDEDDSEELSIFDKVAQWFGPKRSDTNII